ncbi:MAG: hypothetical protein FJ316_04965 [SAR202 cluster bacterium]|nr:hypothetical protein [SAR202 cluster bacterium]
MPGEIALVGGNEFRAGTTRMDRAILAASGQDSARVVVLPTAAAWYTPEHSAAHGVGHFNSLGGDARPLMVLERSHANDPGFAQALGDAHVIYFAGGSPDHLLEVLQDSLLLQAMLQAVERGAVLAGSSAGAMVLGAMMRRPERGGWVKALGVVPQVAVLPHHEDKDPAEIAQQLESQVPASLTVLGIDARTACLGSPGRWRVLGVGRVVVYRNGQWTSHKAGEQLPAGV